MGTLSHHIFPWETYARRSLQPPTYDVNVHIQCIILFFVCCVSIPYILSRRQLLALTIGELLWLPRERRTHWCWYTVGELYLLQSRRKRTITILFHKIPTHFLDLILPTTALTVTTGETPGLTQHTIPVPFLTCGQGLHVLMMDMSLHSYYRIIYSVVGRLVTWVIYHILKQIYTFMFHRKLLYCYSQWCRVWQNRNHRPFA